MTKIRQCEICKEEFDENDLDMANGMWICKDCEHEEEKFNKLWGDDDKDTK
jgi:formylmethanofuran dehydrogenase subunit E